MSNNKIQMLQEQWKALETLQQERLEIQRDYEKKAREKDIQILNIRAGLGVIVSIMNK